MTSTRLHIKPQDKGSGVEVPTIAEESILPSVQPETTPRHLPDNPGSEKDGNSIRTKYMHSWK